MADRFAGHLRDESGSAGPRQYRRGREVRSVPQNPATTAAALAFHPGEFPQAREPTTCSTLLPTREQREVLRHGQSAYQPPVMLECPPAANVSPPRTGGKQDEYLLRHVRPCVLGN